MNVWNALNAMNANKHFPLLVALGFLATLGASVDAIAQGSAPALFNVQEILVQYVRFSNPQASDACALTREDTNKTLMKALALYNLPAIAIADAKPPMMGVARIELVPEISTINAQGLDCTSWISLSAQSQNNVRVPPVDMLRNVTIVYWHKGVLVTTDLSTHNRTVEDIFEKLVKDFAQQYHVDQPIQAPAH